ncbi:hypothetical protein BX616_010569 [Lobosporangium transversale]|uniref:Uncharacterized protein n=1 Tax=Lobosporangium transversale TaxID=64571 RepID=A0A1Y2GPS3_9FUNG|nr:hypothetical protein BCR41DRAFT_395445 [Lobosporangium transversale]KAF9911477.1 hypothetical protein BX616_010569 [Lobosporangium transversale]ORZ18207.1 hypothetical protein BCR41DRAFT_395445 [Lobosporangium transversale]|eukprot:XP_021882002.1 hypothetical protein BCR41DRAFT_395445 [Lobosporangium transversale]
MFLPWTIFAVNATLALFQFLMIGTVGSVLSIYSRLGDKYANSIRWTRQGGYLEMIKSLYNSHGATPNRVKAVMVATLLISLAASLLDKGVAHFINPAARPGKTNTTMVVTRQAINPGRVYHFGGWAGVARNDESIVEIMASMINSTRNIPNAVSGRTYTPRLTPYDSLCDFFDLTVLGLPGTSWEHPKLALMSGGCSALHIHFFNFPLDFEVEKATVTQSSEDQHRWTIVFPGTWNIEESLLGAMHSFQGRDCEASETYAGQDYTDQVDQLDTSLLTEMTKCILSTGDVIVLSIGTVRFSVAEAEEFETTTATMFSDRMSIFQDMATDIRTAIKKYGYEEYPLLMEVQASGTSFDILACTFFMRASRPRPSCIFANINSQIIRPRKNDTDIATALNGRPFGGFKRTTFSEKATSAIRIQKLPIADENGSVAPTNISQIRVDTAAATGYMASLGQNFYADYNQSQLYVLYDTLDMELGLDIPLWLLITVGTLMGLCMCVWAATEMLLDEKYTSSFFKITSMQLKSHTNIIAPALLPSKMDPLELAGVRAFPELSEEETEVGSDKALLQDIQKVDSSTDSQ